MSSVSISKIGGSNMGNMEQLIPLIQAMHAKRERIIFVVSAFAKELTSEQAAEQFNSNETLIKATNLLIQAMDDLEGKDYDASLVDTAFSNVHRLHSILIEQFFNEDGRSEIHKVYQQEFDALKVLLINHQKAGGKSLQAAEGSYKIRDEVIGFGERMAGKFLEMYLAKNGYPSHFFDHVKATDLDLNGSGRVNVSKLHRCIQEGIKTAVTEDVENLAQLKRGEVIGILGGHVGNTPHGIAVDVGRSYSDTTAVDAAIALRDELAIDKVRFWKDVDGVMTANPKQLKKGQKPVIHPRLSFLEGLEMGAAGSPLLQVSALSLAQKGDVNLWLGNIRDSSGQGTHFSKTREQGEGFFKTIVSKEDVDVVTISIPDMADQGGFLSKVSEVFARQSLNIMATADEGTSLTFVVQLPQDKSDRKQIREKLGKALRDLQEIEVDGEIYPVSDPSWQQGLTAISVIGHELKKLNGPSLISGVLETEEDVPFSSFVSPKTKMTFVVPSHFGKRAVQLLHAIFIDRDPEAIESYHNAQRKRLAIVTNTLKD